MITPDILQTLPLFGALSSAETTDLAQAASLRRYAAGQVISWAGETCRDLYILTSGTVRIFKLSSDGRKQQLDCGHPGDVFLGAPTFCSCPRAAIGQAEGDAEILVVPARAMQHLIEQHPAIAIHILRLCCARIRRLADLAAELSSRNLVRRLAWLLLNYCLCQHHWGGHQAYHLTEEEMASRLASTQESISRALGELRERGIVETRRNEVVVCDAAALQRVAAGQEADL